MHLTEVSDEVSRISITETLLFICLLVLKQNDWTKGTPLYLRFSICLCCRNFLLWFLSFCSDEWVEKEEGEGGSYCAYKGLLKCPLLHLEGENPAGSAMGKVPRQEPLLAMTPPPRPPPREQPRNGEGNSGEGCMKTQRKFWKEGK